MFNQFIRRILKLGLYTRDFFASATGCVVLLPGSRVDARAQGGIDTGASHRVEPARRRPLPGLGAALFLLGVALMEGLSAIRAFAR